LPLFYFFISIRYYIGWLVLRVTFGFQNQESCFSDTSETF